MPHYGATPEAWAHFDLVLGLGEDLLPVVCRPDAQISDASKMKALGKTPSLYNREGKVVGITDWTAKRATPAEISRWSAQDDYGICLQTRSVRGLDIDVEDQDLAERIAVRAAELMVDIEDPPMRFRAGTGKCLLAFTVPGDLPKRAFKVKGGLVEFLATGQQMVVCGRHTSGTYYEWAGGLPDSFPRMSEQNFDRLWRVLVKEFALEPDTAGSGVARLRGADLDIADDVVPWLEAEWETYGFDKGGQLFVRCPWRDSHSGDSGETEATYFPAGSGGYQRGHWRCLHASCQGRTDEDFLDAVGYRASLFEVLPDPESLPPGAELAAARRELMPSFVRDKQGGIEPVVGNVQKALMRPDVCGLAIGYDEFRGALMACPDGEDAWRPFADQDYFTVAVTLEQKGFKPVGRQLIRDAVGWVAREHKFDSAQQWLAGLVWDGVPRVEGFLPSYFGSIDTAYTRAVSRYMWTALAGRVIEPGVKADMAPIAVGGQGQRKSWGFAAISPDPEFFAEFNLTDRDENLSRKMRGTLVGELAELRGLKTRDAEGIKAWVSQRYEKWTPKYLEFETTFPRRLVLFGTSNPDDILDDETGNRRWLPFRAGDVAVEAIERDRDQLWAEAKGLFNRGGVDFAEAEKLARLEHHEYRTTDSWEEHVEAWLDGEELGGGTPRGRDFLTTSEVLAGAVGLDARSVKRVDEMRIGKVLRALGFERAVKWSDGKSLRVWLTTLPPLA